MTKRILLISEDRTIRDGLRTALCDDENIIISFADSLILLDDLGYQAGIAAWLLSDSTS